MYPFRIVPDGDAALLVELPGIIDPGVNAWCVALAGRVRAEHALAVRDVVVGFCSTTVYFDPLAADAAWLERALREIATTLQVAPTMAGNEVEVPVCYEGEFGPDLEAVASFGRCGISDVIAWHAAVTYRVYLIGFVPGFAYMAHVDERIAAPRRPTPRTAVPAGSVAIAGRQTGIYPVATPGGWNIVGRTPLRPFAAERAQPSLFAAGDHVRFRPISADEFSRLADQP